MFDHYCLCSSPATVMLLYEDCRESCAVNLDIDFALILVQNSNFASCRPAVAYIRAIQIMAFLMGLGLI